MPFPVLVLFSDCKDMGGVYSSLQKSSFLENLLPELRLYVYRNTVFLLTVLLQKPCKSFNDFQILGKESRL